MEEGEYLRIYRSLNSLEDLDKFDHPKGILLSILTQKAVRKAKVQYRRVEAEADSLRERWSGGSPILAIARAVGLPPVLTAFILLRGEGLSRRRVRALLRDPKGPGGGSGRSFRKPSWRTSSIHRGPTGSRLREARRGRGL